MIDFSNFTIASFESLLKTFKSSQSGNPKFVRIDTLGLGNANKHDLNLMTWSLNLKLLHKLAIDVVFPSPQPTGLPAQRPSSPGSNG